MKHVLIKTAMVLMLALTLLAGGALNTHAAARTPGQHLLACAEEVWILL